jgi:hypothetical protein
MNWPTKIHPSKARGIPITTLRTINSFFGSTSGIACCFAKAQQTRSSDLRGELAGLIGLAGFAGFERFEGLVKSLRLLSPYWATAKEGVHRLRPTAMRAAFVSLRFIFIVYLSSKIQDFSFK